VITCDDVLVTVQHERVILYSKRHGVVVRPYLTCAHAAHSPELPAAYRFLFAVSCQGVDPLLMWQWGEEIDAILFLPRVTYGLMVLSLARWRLRPVDLSELVNAASSQRMRAIEQLRARFGLPRFVNAPTPTEDRMFDLANEQVVFEFVELARKRGQLELTEVFPEPGCSALRGPEGEFMHEILVPLRRIATRHTSPALPYSADLTAQNAAFLDDGWLYFHLMAGPRATESLLMSAVAPTLENHRKRGDIDGWFFVRYADPHPHLRVRVRGNSKLLTATVLPDVLHAVSVCGIPAELRLDTYRPEIRRYGGVSAMALAERIFTANTLAVVEAIQHAYELGKAMDPDWRMAFACITTQRLLEQLLVPDQQRAAFLVRLSETALREVAQSQDAIVARRRALSKALRRQRAELMRAIFDDHPDWREIGTLWTVRMSGASDEVRALKRLEHRGELMRPYVDVVASVIHMHLNRVFMDEPRHHERVVYEFLHQLNRSQSAKATAAKAPDAFGATTPGAAAR